MGNPDKIVVKRDENGRFLPGTVANPKGRPEKDCSLTSLLKVELDKIPPGETQGRTWRELLVLAWLHGALTNPVLLRELLDRVEGRQALALDARLTGDVTVRVVYEGAVAESSPGEPQG